jgi:hypothetical protein
MTKVNSSLNWIKSILREFFYYRFGHRFPQPASEHPASVGYCTVLLMRGKARKGKKTGRSSRR